MYLADPVQYLGRLKKKRKEKQKNIFYKQPK